MLRRKMVVQKLLKNLTNWVKICKTKGDVKNIGEERDILMEQLKALKQIFIEKRLNQRQDKRPPKYYRNTWNKKNLQ